MLIKILLVGRSALGSVEPRRKAQTHTAAALGNKTYAAELGYETTGGEIHRAHASHLFGSD